MSGWDTSRVLIRLNKDRAELLEAIQIAIHDLHYELPSVVIDDLKKVVEKVNKI